MRTSAAPKPAAPSLKCSPALLSAGSSALLSAGDFRTPTEKAEHGKTGFDHRYHRSRWFVSGGILARERLSSLRRHAKVEHEFIRPHRAYHRQDHTVVRRLARRALAGDRAARVAA